MKLSKQLAKIGILLGLAVSFVGIQPACAQNSAIAPATSVTETVVPATSHTIADTRPSIIVVNFESGTVSAKVTDKHGFSAFLAAMRGESDNVRYDPADLGAGIADMIVEKLLNDGGFRLLERKQIDATVREQGIASGTVTVSTTPLDSLARKASMLGARYMITGSVTKFGFENHQVGGLFSTMATFGMVSVRQHKTEVTLSARVIDMTTGEIVAAIQGNGISHKGGGVTLLGMDSNGAGGGSAENRDFKETAIGEATARAVQDLVEKLEAKRSLLAMR
jgi:curli biogenesis system outer membrane secretion channel CsgG